MARSRTMTAATKIAGGLREAVAFARGEDTGAVVHECVTPHPYQDALAHLFAKYGRDRGLVILTDLSASGSNYFWRQPCEVEPSFRLLALIGGPEMLRRVAPMIRHLDPTAIFGECPHPAGSAAAHVWWGNWYLALQLLGGKPVGRA